MNVDTLECARSLERSVNVRTFFEGRYHLTGDLLAAAIQFWLLFQSQANNKDMQVTLRFDPHIWPTFVQVLHVSRR